MNRKQNKDLATLLSDVAAATDLREGEEGVRAILSVVGRAGALSLRDLARRVRMPVPVVAAVRRELEKRGLLDRRGGLALSGKGLDLVDVEMDAAPGCRCPACDGEGFVIPEAFSPLLYRLREMAADRPAVDVTLDQSHAAPETALRRALYLRESEALDRDLLVLGDDDLTSLAVGLLRRQLHLKGRLAVAEIDPRLVACLRRVSDAEGFDIEVHPHDLRAPLPGPLIGTFDAFLTDPPYTLEGLRLFVSRGGSALRPGVGRQAFICFGHRSPDEQREVVRTISDAGLGIVEMRPAFNRYDGAQLLAGVSAMIRAVTTSHTVPPEDPYNGPLYTADKNSRQ
ncbi:MAG: putative methyltransferase [Candidatus Latescibacteria bacterium]|nr:putative methyltransferase [Candidatus Latescibacterota bacterium]